MPEIPVEVYVYCSCGEHLCNQSEYDAGKSSANRGTPCLVVEPCEKCKERARDEGYEEGYRDAGREARDADQD